MFLASPAVTAPLSGLKPALWANAQPHPTYLARLAASPIPRIPTPLAEHLSAHEIYQPPLARPVATGPEVVSERVPTTAPLSSPILADHLPNTWTVNSYSAQLTTP